MMKYLLLLVLGILVWRFWSKRAPKRDVPPDAAEVETMVRCAQCGVYLPVTDALAADGRHFCNEAHRRAATPPQD